MLSISVLMFLAFCGKETANDPPSIQGIQGPRSGYVGQSYDYSATVSDPENDRVAVRFDWGDGEVSEWSFFFSPDVGAAGFSHTFTAAGTYQIRAQAKDTLGNISDWSDPVTVTIEEFPFRITRSAYPDSSDLVADVQAEFGTDYTVADWNDVKNWCAAHSADDFIELLDWELGEQYSLLVLWNGEGYWNGRHYFMTRFDHNPPVGYLIHDDIDDNHIVLGSWSPVSMRILAVKKCQEINP